MKQAISISIKEKNDILQYSVRWKNKPNGEEGSCKSFEFPRPELLQALNGFAEYVPFIFGIPKEVIGKIYIAGATFIYDKAEEMVGLTLGTCLVMQNGRCIDIKTPEQRLRLDNPDLEESTMWEDRFTKDAQILHDEIVLYADGKRAQTELQFDEEGDDQQ